MHSVDHILTGGSPVDAIDGLIICPQRRQRLNQLQVQSHGDGTQPSAPGHKPRVGCEVSLKQLAEQAVGGRVDQPRGEILVDQYRGALGERHIRNPASHKLNLAGVSIQLGNSLGNVENWLALHGPNARGAGVCRKKRIGAQARSNLQNAIVWTDY